MAPCTRDSLLASRSYTFTSAPLRCKSLADVRSSWELWHRLSGLHFTVV